MLSIPHSDETMTESLITGPQIHSRPKHQQIRFAKPLQPLFRSSKTVGHRQENVERTVETMDRDGRAQTSVVQFRSFKVDNLDT